MGLSSDGGVAQLFATGLNSLAQGDAAVLTSTSPAEISARFGDTPSIIVTLAERAQITVGFPAQPAVIEIDGEETGAVWADGILTIDLQPGRHEIKLTP